MYVWHLFSFSITTELADIVLYCTYQSSVNIINVYVCFYFFQVRDVDNAVVIQRVKLA